MITVLVARRFSVSDEVRERIESCTDLAVLESWVAKAVDVQSPEQLFE